MILSQPLEHHATVPSTVLANGLSRGLTGELTDTLARVLATVVAALESTSSDAAQLRDLDDTTLLSLTDLGAHARRLLDARTALIAGEIARRSQPDLAHTGLAQRLGHRTAEELLRATTGESRRDVTTAINAGRLLAASPDMRRGPDGLPLDLDSSLPVDPDVLPPAPTHLQPAVAAVRSGVLSPAALDALRSGLGDPSDTVSSAMLRAACEELVEAARTLDVDRLHRLSRQHRENLDVESIIDRERTQRAARSFRLTTLPDGMTRATWLLDPESAVQVRELVDRAITPKRRTVHFTDLDDAAKAARIADDDRTSEQYASDALLHLLRAGADADSSMILGTGAPTVRVLVTARDLNTGTGSASFEPSLGHPEGTVVALPTAHRLLCGGTHTPILISSTGQPLDVGRSQRLFTARQRVALAARDGGCRWPGCERAPSWCEAHHIDHWHRGGGDTNVEAGILLCRHHHLLLHDQGWTITRTNDTTLYALTPPSSVDPEQHPRPMPGRSREWQRALAC